MVIIGLKNKSNAGFTLIELMIVIAIVGVLAAIALPAYNNYNLRSNMSQLAVSSKAVKTALETCVQTRNDVTNNCAPGAFDVPANFMPATEGQVGVQTNWVNPTTVSIQVFPKLNSTLAALDDLTYQLNGTIGANGALTWTLNCQPTVICPN